MRQVFLVDQEQSGRIDCFLTQILDMSRSHIKKLIENGCVLIDNFPILKAGFLIKKGQQIVVDFPDIVPMTIAPQNLPIDIVYEDDDLAIVNKRQGMTVHPSGGNLSGTLVNALLYSLNSLSGINGVERPGIVHRLDKDTSGLMAVAKNDKAHISLSKQISQKTAKREYLALCEGVFKCDDGRIETRIGRDSRDRKKMAVVDEGGRVAISFFSVVQRYSKFTLVRFELMTGRTHQIRVHSKHIGHPIVGDKTYGYKNQSFVLDGQLLHSQRLSIIHPSTNEKMTFEAPLPDYFCEVLKKLEK